MTEIQKDKFTLTSIEKKKHDVGMSWERNLTDTR